MVTYRYCLFSHSLNASRDDIDFRHDSTVTLHFILFTPPLPLYDFATPRFDIAYTLLLMALLTLHLTFYRAWRDDAFVMAPRSIRYEWRDNAVAITIVCWATSVLSIVY